MKRRAKSVALWTGLLALAGLSIAGIAGEERLVEEWCRWRIRTGDEADRLKAAQRLLANGSIPAAASFEWPYFIADLLGVDGEKVEALELAKLCEILEKEVSQEGEEFAYAGATTDGRGISVRTTIRGHGVLSSLLRTFRESLTPGGAGR